MPIFMLQNYALKQVFSRKWFRSDHFKVRNDRCSCWENIYNQKSEEL